MNFLLAAKNATAEKEAVEELKNAAAKKKDEESDAAFSALGFAYMVG